MRFFTDIYSVRLFLRLLLGLILLGAAFGKLAHPTKFGRAIQDYKVFPQKLESKLALSTILSFGIPLAELGAGVGLVSGFLLTPAVGLTVVLFVIFSGAIVFNLLRGRTDLSCHCGGILGDHRISWWLVGRNALFIACTLILIFTPSDPFTIDTIVRRSSSLSATLWVSTALPVILFVLSILVVLVLLNAARTVLCPQ